MKKIILLMLMLCISIGYSVNVQAQPAGGLKIGDKLPALPMAKVLIDGKLNSFNTADYKDKLLILDFWDTSCSSCIDAMPRMDSLQKIYGDKIQIVTITHQKEQVIRDFKAKNRIAKSVSLPMMLEDTLLKSYFPHYYVSHTVWVNKGEIMAISHSEYVHKKIIDKVLNGEKVSLPVKDDFLKYDIKNSSFLGKSAQAKDRKIYSVVSGYKEGVTSKGGETSSVTDSVNGTVKDTYLNINGIARLYISLLLKIKPFYYILTPSMIIIEAQNPGHYDMSQMKTEFFSEDWVRENGVCYESVLPASLSVKERAKLQLLDLDNKLGLHGRMEARPNKVWVIKDLAGPRPLADEAKDGKSLGKQSHELFMGSLFYNMLAERVPFVDESSDKKREFTSYTFNDVASMKRALNLNGLEVVEEIRPVEVFVLTETRK